MIDHVGINVSDYERSKAFYVEALAPLGYELGISRRAAPPGSSSRRRSGGSRASGSKRGGRR